MKLNEEEDLERFIVEQRQRIAKDREVLDKNPTSAVTEYILDSSAGRRQKVCTGLLIFVSSLKIVDYDVTI